MACTRLTTWTEPWIATQALATEDTDETVQAGKEADGSSADYVYDLYALNPIAANDGPDALAALGAPLVQVGLCHDCIGLHASVWHGIGKADTTFAGQPWTAHHASMCAGGGRF